MFSTQLNGINECLALVLVKLSLSAKENQNRIQVNTVKQYEEKTTKKTKYQSHISGNVNKLIVNKEEKECGNTVSLEKPNNS